MTPDIDGDLLDRIERELRHARGKDQAVTAAELAGRVGIKDGEASPKTREAIKTLMRERNVPVVSGGNGYYIPATNAEVDEYLESLEGRIDGIRERKQLLRENWDAWTAGQAQMARTDGGEDRDDVPELDPEKRRKIENDDYLTIGDYLEHHGGEA